MTKKSNTNKRVKNVKQKGNQFEIQICKSISKYLTCDARDDLFWRSSNSGGRQTVRYKKGVDTHNQAGDITNTHPDGELFMDVFTVECKNYKSISIWSLITGSSSDSIVGWWKIHVDKAKEVNKHPLLLVKQNYKPILLVCDRRISARINSYFNLNPKLVAYQSDTEKMYIYLFDDIMDTDPETFKLLLQQMKK